MNVELYDQSIRSALYFYFQEEVIRTIFEKDVGRIEDFTFYYGRNSRGVSYCESPNPCIHPLLYVKGRRIRNSKESSY
jgi:hypothetical protein